jgi:hypothetical protein
MPHADCDSCSLDGNDIGPEGAKAFATHLVQNHTLASLKYPCWSVTLIAHMLSLMYNDIGDIGGAALAKLLHANSTIELGFVVRGHCTHPPRAERGDDFINSFV